MSTLTGYEVFNRVRDRLAQRGISGPDADKILSRVHDRMMAKGMMPTSTGGQSDVPRDYGEAYSGVGEGVGEGVTPTPIVPGDGGGGLPIVRTLAGQYGSKAADVLSGVVPGLSVPAASGMVGKAASIADAGATRLAAAYPQMLGQLARLTQGVEAAYRNPGQTLLRTGASATKAILDPGGTFAGMPGAATPANLMVPDAGRFASEGLDAMADQVPTAPAGPVASAWQRGLGGVADRSGQLSKTIAGLAPSATDDFMSPEYIAGNVAGSAPQTLGMMVVGMLAGPEAALPAMFGMSATAETASIIDDTFNELKRNDPGMSDDEALTRSIGPALLMGIPAGALDAGSGAEAAAVRGMVERQAESVAKSVARKLLGAGKELGRTALEEAVQEPTQGIMEDIGTAMAQPSMAPITPQDVAEQAKKRLTESVVSMASSVAGGGIGISGHFEGVGESSKPTPPRPKAVPREDAEPVTPPPSRGGTDLHPEVAKAIADLEARLTGKANEAGTPATSAAEPAAPGVPSTPDDAAMARVLADLGIDPAAFEARVQEERDRGLIDADPRTLSPEDRERQKRAVAAEVNRRAKAFQSSPQYQAEEARKAEMLRLAQERPNDRGGDPNEGGAVAGGVRSPGPDRMPGRDGVDVPQDVRPVENRVAPMVGGEGQQAGDQPGDVGGGRSDAEVSNWYGMSQDEERADLARRIAEHERTGKTREEAFASAQDDLNAGADSLLSQDGAILEDEYGDRYQVQHTAAERGGPKNQRALVKLTEDGNPIGDPNSQPWISPDDARRTARSLRRVNPQQPGAVTAAREGKEPTSEVRQEEGQQKGRQAPLLTTKPAAPEQGSTGVFSPPPAGAEQSAPSVSPNLDSMSHDELKAYAKSIGVPPRGSPAGIRARIRKAQADQLSAKDNPAKTDSSIPKVLPWSVSSVNDEVYVKNNRDGARVSRFGWAKVFKSGGEWTAQLFDDNGRPGEVLAKSKIKGRASAAAKEWMQRSIDRETGGQAPGSSVSVAAPQATEASPRGPAKTQAPSGVRPASTATTPEPSANQTNGNPVAVELSDVAAGGKLAYTESELRTIADEQLEAARKSGQVPPHILGALAGRSATPGEIESERHGRAGQRGQEAARAGGAGTQAAGEVGGSDSPYGKQGGIAPPAYRDWRTIRRAANSVRVVPNVPGAKFTAEQISTIASWADGNGWTVVQKSPNGMVVLSAAGGKRLEIDKYGAPGVKSEKAAEARKGQEAAEDQKRAEQNARADNRDSADWINETFGEGFANGFNRNALSDFLEGETPTLKALPTSKWEPGLRKVGAVTDDGRVDMKALKAAYAARDVEKLAEYLDPRNKVLRAEFAARAGLERMPPGITRTRAAVEAWAASSQSPSAPSGAPVPSRSAEPSPQPTTSRAPESAASPAASSTPGSSGASAGTTTGEGTASTQSTPKSNIQKAREKAQARREAKVLDTQVNTREYGVVTRRDLVDRELADGYTPETVEVTDTAAVTKAEGTKALMDKRGDVPFGNPNHPETIRYRELQKTLMIPPKVPEYRMNKGDRYRVLTKIEYDYAAGKAKESAPAQPESKPNPYADDIAKLTPLLDKVLNSKDIPRKQAIDVGIVLNGEAPKVQEALAARLWEKSPEVAEYVVKDGPIGVRSVVQKARPAIETRAGLGLRQNSAGKWAWFEGDSQKTGAYATADEARQSPEIEAIESNRKRSEEQPAATSIKSHPEYARLHRMYGASSREQIQAKIDQMTAEIAGHAKVAQREFTGQGTRRTGAAVSAQAVRDIGNEKLLLTAYMNERFPPATPKVASATPDVALKEAPKPSGFLSNLSAADQARAEELRQKIAKKLAQQQSTLGTNAGGFDPEMLSLGAEYASLHIKAGAKRFAVFAREMVTNLGDGIRPYLKALYSAARQMPGVDKAGTDSGDYVDGLADADIEAMVGGGAGPIIANDNDVERGTPARIIEEGPDGGGLRGATGGEGPGPDRSGTLDRGAPAGSGRSAVEGDRPQDAQSDRVVDSVEEPPADEPPTPSSATAEKYRQRAADMVKRAEALERNSSARFDSAPGAAVTGGSGRHRSGLHKKTDQAIEGSLNDLRKAKELREAAGRWRARADRHDPVVIQREAEAKAKRDAAREGVKAKESAERKAAPLINEDGPGVERMTSAEWKKLHADYKSVSVRDGVRVRTAVVKGSLSEVFITDMPVKTREEAKRSQAAETKATPVPESAQPITIVGDAERIEFEGGGSMLRYSLSDGSFLDEAEGRVTHWRPVGPGRQIWGIFEASAEDALADINGIRTVRVQKSSETAQTTTPPAKPDEIGKYRVFERPGEGWAVNWTDQSGATQGRRGLKTREEAESLAREWDARDKENEADRRSRHPMTLAEYPKVRDRIMSGQQTAEEHKDLARWLVRSEEAIKAELDSRTLKQLAPNGVRSGTTKAEVVNTIYRNMLSRFHLGDSVSYNPFAKETYESALLKQIEATTDADIAAFVEKRQKAVDSRKKALENPETLDEFRQFIEKNGEAALSVEQRKKYDELTAAVNKRMRGDDRPDYIAKVDTGGVQLTVKEGFHEKQGIPLWIVQMSGRVDSDAYKALVEAAKKLGGWWSSFKKESTGFQFKTKAAADEFVQINQKSITTETTDKAREETQAEKAAARLIEMADAKIEAADEELGRDRNTNTIRRARMADSAEAGARKAKQMAETLANIAEGIQNGTAKALRGIRNMAQLEELERSLMLAQREYWYSLPEESRRAIDPSGNWWNLPMDENIIAKAVMPMPEPHKDHVRAIASTGMTTPGIKREAAKLDKLWRYSEKRNPDSPVVKIDSPYDFNAAKAVASRLKGAGAAKYAAESVYDALMHHQRVADMGIKSSAEMRVALREYMGFRVGQAQPDAVREMERGLIGKTVGIDFFPTPPALASEVVDKADIEPGMKVLEPSAGNGRIADAIKAAGVTPDVAEVSGNLRAILEKKGYPLEGRDFMEFNPGPVYDRIVMNPPFSNRMDVEHVRHAYDLLKPGGRIVAIMSEGPFFGRDKKASEFRDWLDTVGTSEQLPEGSFQSDKSGLPTTGVNARVVVIDKPQAGEKAQAPQATPAAKSTPSDPLHDKVMDFRQRLNDATKRSDLTGMEDEARMLADAADRAGRSDLITMARGFIGQVQEKSGRLASQEYRSKQAAKATEDTSEAGFITFPDMPTRSEEMTREYAAMGYQGSGLTKTLEEAQKRIKDNGIQADIAKERDGYRILRKYPGTPVLTLDQLRVIRDWISDRGGLARLDGLTVSAINAQIDPDLRYLAMRYIANQDVPRVGVEAKNAAHELMGEAPKQESAASAPLADLLKEKMKKESDSRRAFYRSTGQDAEAKAKSRVEEERLRREADAMAPEIVRAVEASIGEYPGDIPSVKTTQPAADTKEAAELFRAHEQANEDMEGLWAQERELDREVASKKHGTKVREAAENRREKLRTTIGEAKAEWTKKRDAMIRMRQEHAWNGPDLWRKLGVMTSWYPGRYTEVATYLTKAADFIVGAAAPELSAEDRGIVARDAVSNFLETPLSDSLTGRIDQKLYVFTKKANQKAAIDRVNAASPLQTHERSKFIRDIENTDDKDAMGQVAAEAEAMAAERNAQEAEVERIQAEAEAKEKESNTAALTDPSKMRATTARQAMGKRALPAGSPVNGTNKLAVWTENIPAKLRSQIESLGEEPITVRGNALTSEAMARMAGSLADKSAELATIVGAVGRDGEPFVMFAYGKDGVGAVNGKLWAYANTLGQGEWFTDGSGDHLVLKSDGKPIVMVAGIRKEAVPPVNLEGSKARASRGWKDASEPSPKTYLTPKSTAPTETIDQSAYPSLEDLGIKTEYSALVAKAEQATRDYHAALEAVSDARNRANTSLTDEVILAKARAMSGDDEPSSGFRSIAVDALIRENPDLKAATAAVEVAQKAKILAERAVEAERYRAASAFNGEAEDKYRGLIADRKWWQHDAEANAIERLWSSDPRVAVLRELANTAANSYEIDTRGEILPPNFKPGVGVGNVSESSVNFTTDKPSAMGVSTADIEARARKRGKADWTIELTTWPGDSSDPNGAWLASDRLKPVEAMVKLAKTAPEFGADPVLTASGDKLVWTAGTESFAFVNPWYKSAEEPGPIADGQTVRIDVDALKNLRGKVWARPVADTVAVAESAPAKKALTLLEKLERAADQAMDRIKKRGIQNRGRTSGATTLIDDTLDAAVVVAAKAVAGGIRGGQKLTRLVSDVLASLKAAGGKSAVLDDVEGVRKVARKLLRDAGGMDAALADPTAILRAYAANREALDRRRTRNVGKAVGDTAGVKAAVAGEARERPGVTKPGDAREARLLNQVQQGENREASARAAGEQAGFRAGQAVGEQTGGAKVRSSAAREIVRSRREAYKAGVAEAKAGIPAMVRQLRQEQTRQRQTAEIERRGAVDATKAVSDQEAAIREGIRKLAQKLPMPVRGKFLRAVEASSKPLHLARAVRDMSKALSRYEAARAARAASKWGSPAYLKRLTNAEREIVRGHMRTVKATWQTVKEAGTNADQMYAAARALEDAYRAIRTVYAQHYAETHAIKALRGETAKEAAAQAVENIERAKKPMAESERVEDVDANAVTKLGRGFMDLRNATESVEGKHDGTGVLYNLMHRVMTMAEDAYFTEKRKRYAQIEKAVKAAGFDGLADAFEKLTGAGGKALQSTIRVPLGGQARTISLGQAASLAAIDPSSEDLISRGMKVQMREGRFLTPMAVTMDEIDRLRLRLKMEHPGLLRMVAAFKGIMEEMRPDVFRVHRILKGFEPEIVHDRWPRVRNLSAGENTQSLPESSHEMVNRVLENSGFLKERTGGTDAPMMVDDVLNVVFDQVDQAAKVTHIALPVRDAANVLLDTRVRTAIASRWGGKFYTDLKRMLMASSRANQVLNTPGARIVHMLNSNIAVTALASNVGTYMRQAAGLTRLTPYLSAADWAHGVASVPKVSMKEMTDASGYLWDRYIGSPAGRMSPVMSEGAEAMDRPGIGRAMRQTIANVKAGDIWSAYKAWQRGGKAIMEGVNLADSIVARAAWAGFMRQAEREHPEWSKRRRTAWVAQQTADVVRETQNGSSPLDLSINSAMSRDSGMAAFFLFTSDPLKARNRIARAYKQSVAEGAKQTAAEAASILIGISLARGAGWVISQGVAAALGGDDRDRKRITEFYFAPERILANAAREVAGDVAPVFGPALTDLLTQKGQQGSGLNPPALQAVNDMLGAIGSIKTAVQSNRNSVKKFLLALADAANAADSVVGLNPFHALWSKIWGEAKRHI